MQPEYLSDISAAKLFDRTRSWTWRQSRNDPSFPRPIRLTDCTTRWRRSELIEWAESKAPASKRG